ncbi:hypothetical protein CVT24_004637 [Panaeolus cyanescens]|uniref:Uncharacterized protein n=1 Tax=Panaeolus cyanescens TaxID=181874 RepID=A0A409YSK2_9AGAR|nr:hypothetical protein CVT24_004637 [Panaeolus cyanescens]
MQFVSFFAVLNAVVVVSALVIPQGIKPTTTTPSEYDRPSSSSAAASAVESASDAGTTPVVKLHFDTLFL